MAWSTVALGSSTDCELYQQGQLAMPVSKAGNTYTLLAVVLWIDLICGARELECRKTPLYC